MIQPGMTTRDWCVQALASVFLAIWFWLVTVILLRPSMPWLICTLVGTFLAGLIVGLRSVHNLKDAILRGSGPVLFVFICFFPLLGENRFVPGGGKHIFFVLLLCPIAIFGASTTAWMRSR